MSLTISLVQTSLVWEDKQANLDHLDKLLAQLPAADLIVLPEMFTTGFSMSSSRLAEPMNGPGVQWMHEQAHRSGSALVGSLIINSNGSYYNRLILMHPDGSFQTYDKKHLFRMSDENNHYDAGKEPLIFSMKGFNINFQICYDLRFPVWLRNTQNYDLLVFVANWPAARRHHWRTLLQARAIENLSYVVGVNRIGMGNGTDYAGDSMVVDYAGELVTDLKSEAGTRTVTLEKSALQTYRHSFPAWKDADSFQFLKG